MLHCNLVGFFKFVLQEDAFGVFHRNRRSLCKLCSRETATWLSWRGSSQLAECALSLFVFTVHLLSSERDVQCCLLSPSDCSSDTTVQKSIIIILWWWWHSYTSLTTNGSFISIIFLTYYGMVVPPRHPVHSVCGVCRVERRGWCAGAYFLLKVTDTALVLLSWYQWQKVVCICLKTMRWIF